MKMIININIETKKTINEKQVDELMKKFVRSIDYFGEIETHQILIICGGRVKINKKHYISKTL